MRDEPRLWRGSVTIILLVLNAVAFVAQVIAARAGVPVDDWFALSTDGLGHGFAWQLLTFQFMHGGLMHLLLNSWGIYVFGRAVEDAVGGARWLQLYLMSGVCGGLVQIAGNLVLPRFFGDVPLVGASAGLYGLIGVFALLFPQQRLTLLLFFVLPVTLTARMLVIFSAVIAGLGLLLGGDNVAHAAHLGGLGAGMIFIRLMLAGRWPSFNKFAEQRPRSRQPEFARTASASGPFWQRAAAPEEPESLPPEEFISREVDPILDKISAHGIQSLTDRERKILDAARKKMVKR